MYNLLNKKGFTLIELLIVVAIIGILAAIAIPNFLEAQVRAKVARVKGDLHTVQIGCESYAVDWNYYPVNLAAYNGPSNYSWSLDWIFGLTTPVAYMSSVSMKDPFREVPQGWASVSFVYFNLEGRWGAQAGGYCYENAVGDSETKGCFAISFGPDRSYSSLEALIWTEAGFNRANGNAFSYDGYWGGSGNRLDAIYDPTNGTISGGDIGLFAGDMPNSGISGIIGG